MITKEEREEIINASVEKTLLLIPEVVGNLLANHAALHKINAAFYKAHPEFSARKDIVQVVVEMIEGKNPLMDYEDILQKAVPEIQRQLVIAQDINTTDMPGEMPKNFSDIDLPDNGII